MPDPIIPLNAALEGRYRIERQLGEGGMATVYLADDLRHERKVALKVLKPELAAVVGAERFLAEIKTTANLQHPHILPLFDSGEADSFLFYVMPYVEGESLRERLDREHQLPVDEAVQIAKNVTEALDYAHRHGVIHRDIKPANILLHDGEPVVSDFGIALALGAAGRGRLTETGLSLGTPHYMSPEQATGDLSVGAATDVYALGCVLYEMLVGEPPYTGSTPQAVLGKIIQAEPVSATKARRTVPVNVDAAVRKALEKVPADRFSVASEFARALGDVGFRHGESVAAAGGKGGWAARVSWKRASITALAFAAGAASAVTLLHSSRSGPPVVSFTVPVGEGADVYLGGGRDAAQGWPAATSLAISPNGELLAYSAWQAGSNGAFESRVYLRRLDQERADPVAGTEGASTPFFSPDGEWIGFFAGQSLRRVRIDGGGVETIVAQADIPTNMPRGASWGDDGTILYAGVQGLYRVAATGGEPALVAEDPFRGYRHSNPVMLPGSHAALFTAWASYNPEEAEVVGLDLATGDTTSLIPDAMDPLFVATGDLLFMRRGSLMAVRFDPNRLQVLGEPFLLREDVMQAIGMWNTGWETGAAQVAVSPTGHLAYATGGIHPDLSAELVRVRRDAQVELLVPDHRSYMSPRVSPDGARLAFNVLSGMSVAVMVHDLARGVRGVTEPLRTGLFAAPFPVWSPDGRSIAFSSVGQNALRAMYRAPVDGSTEPERMAPSDRAQQAASWSADGVLAYMEGGDIWVLPPGGEPAPFFTSTAFESYPVFSSDGRWLAYESNQTGSDEVYVRPYPGPDPATRVSVDGGFAPAWSPDATRLYFLAPNGDMPVMMSAEMTRGDDLRVGVPSVLIEPWPYRTSTPIRSYDVLPDGSFVAVRFADPDQRDVRTFYRVEEIHVMLNFLEELRERMGDN